MGKKKNKKKYRDIDDINDSIEVAGLITNGSPNGDPNGVRGFGWFGAWRREGQLLREARLIQAETFLDQARVDKAMVKVRVAGELDRTKHDMWMRREGRRQAAQTTTNMVLTNRLLKGKCRETELNVKLIKGELKQRNQLSASSVVNEDEQ